MNNATATFIGNEISVRHSVRPDVRREFLAFSIDNGWDDVKKVHKKVLKFQDRKFVFSGWNSDTNECIFFRPLNQDPDTATIL